ncbi:MAG: hypothetical protein RBQ88_07410 [Desulfobulbus oligotrophicus]|jgi:hypothetical protein|nr:hypothetical protein [Desulfobulbus oligotrophicus]
MLPPPVHSFAQYIIVLESLRSSLSFQMLFIILFKDGTVFQVN